MNKRFILFAISALLAMSFFASSAMASHDVPVGGTPMRVPLVPAFKGCTSANSTHGVPLNFPSCNPPVPASDTVRGGSGTIGSAWLIVCNLGATAPSCNTAGGGGFTTAMQPDIRIFGAAWDIQCRMTGTPLACVNAGDDYNPNGMTGPYTTTCVTAADCGNDGRPLPFCAGACSAGVDIIETAIMGTAVSATVSPSAQCGTNTTCLAAVGRFVGHAIRVSDHYNCDPGAPGGDPNACPADSTTSTRAATMVDINFPIPVDCLPTSSTSLGSVCGTNTTANALSPGAVLDGKKSVIEIGEIIAVDSGPDGNPGSGSDNQIVATQGLFAP